MITQWTILTHLFPIGHRNISPKTLRTLFIGDNLKRSNLKQTKIAIGPVPWQPPLPNLNSISTDSMFNIENDDGSDTPPLVEEHIALEPGIPLKSH
jgi:hypothetical protein